MHASLSYAAGHLPGLQMVTCRAARDSTAASVGRTEEQSKRFLEKVMSSPRNSKKSMHAIADKRLDGALLRLQ
eukprot:scaffold197410_cov15-Prasinocladus_malaysianus.AAC.1